MERECKGCGERFTVRHNVAGQQYCGKPSCQRLRRSRWQKKKLRQDADYRQNQRRAQQQWRGRHGEYMRQYRQSHPQYRQADASGRRRRHGRAAVKMDEYSSAASGIKSGIFRVCGYVSEGAVKMDEWCCGKRVQVIVLQEEAAEAALGGAP